MTPVFQEFCMPGAVLLPVRRPRSPNPSGKLMVTTKMLVCSAVLSALAIPSLPAQQPSRMSQEMRQELRQIIRSEVRAAVREALAEAHAAPTHGLKAHGLSEEHKKKVEKALHKVGGSGGFVFDLDADVESDGDMMKKLHEAHGNKVFEWHAKPGEKGQVRTFAFPGGNGQFRFERSDDGDEDEDVEVDVRVEHDVPNVFLSRKGHVTKQTPFGQQRQIKMHPGEGEAGGGLDFGRPLRIEKEDGRTVYYFSLGDAGENAAKAKKAKKSKKAENEHKKSNQVRLIRL